jgi:hypothetical protein
MAGILDKKERIFDFVITENGRSQIQNNDIRYKYASLSDFSTVYTKKENIDQTFTNKNEISDVDLSNLFLEVTTKSNNNLNYELNLSDFVSFDNNNLNGQPQNSINFTDVNVNKGLSLGESIINLKLLSTENKINDEAKFTFVDNGYLHNDFEFEDVKESFYTLKKKDVNKKNIPAIVNDKKFKDKSNFKVMMPLSVDGTALYKDSDFSKKENIENYFSDNKFFKYYKHFNSGYQAIDSNLEKKILASIIKDLEKRPDAIKRVYKLEKFSNDNSFMFEMFESSLTDVGILKKMFIIKTGEFYDEEDNTIKRVYQAGHIINTRNDVDETLKEVFSLKNENPNYSNNNVKSFALSAFYSFIVLFTIVIE